MLFGSSKLGHAGPTQTIPLSQTMLNGEEDSTKGENELEDASKYLHTVKEREFIFL